jgi:hypothetical protein
MRFTLLKMAIAGVYARLNVNVFYINLLYVNNLVSYGGGGDSRVSLMEKLKMCFFAPAEFYVFESEGM